MNNDIKRLPSGDFEVMPARDMKITSVKIDPPFERLKTKWTPELPPEPGTFTDTSTCPKCLFTMIIEEGKGKGIPIPEPFIGDDGHEHIHDLTVRSYHATCGRCGHEFEHTGITHCWCGWYGFDETP